MTSFRIGEVAELSGVSVETLRYYERMKLLPVTPRTRGGIRRYDAATVRRVRFIKDGQRLGFALRELRNLIRDATRPSVAGCSRGRDVIEQHIEEIDRQIALLLEHRRQLNELRSGCESSLGGQPGVPCAAMLDAGRLFDPASGQRESAAAD
jgi:DNA-binding transcriptional MerR regulator